MITFEKAVAIARAWGEQCSWVAPDVALLLEAVNSELSIEACDYFCDSMELLERAPDGGKIKVMDGVLRYFWIKVPDGKTIGCAGTVFGSDVAGDSSKV